MNKIANKQEHRSMFNITIIKKTNAAIVCLLLTSGLLFTPSALADSPISIEQRIQKQSAKIQEGVKMGQLTPIEQRILRDEQQMIKRSLNTLSKGDKITSQHTTQLHRKLDKASINIYKLRYNKDRVK